MEGEIGRIVINSQETNHQNTHTKSSSKMAQKNRRSCIWTFEWKIKLMRGIDKQSLNMKHPSITYTIYPVYPKVTESILAVIYNLPIKHNYSNLNIQNI